MHIVCTSGNKEGNIHFLKSKTLMLPIKLWSLEFGGQTIFSHWENSHICPWWWWVIYFTSLKTGYITAYSVIDTMEFVSASFFISSIVILQGGAALGETVRRKLQLTYTHTYTPPLTLTHTPKPTQSPEWRQPREGERGRGQLLFLFHCRLTQSMLTRLCMSHSGKRCHLWQVDMLYDPGKFVTFASIMNVSRFALV